MTESEFGTDEQARGAQNQLAAFFANDLLPPFARLLASAEPSGSRKRILALFDNRVTWGAIRHWKKGRVPPPAWAREKVLARIATAIAYAEKLAADIQNTPRKNKGEIGTMALRKYRAHKHAQK